MGLYKLAKKIHQNAVQHGWWKEKRSIGEIIALCHSELSEALEEHRNGHTPNEIYFSCKSNCRDNNNGICNSKHPTLCDLGKPEGIPVELADCIIRILDFCGSEEINIEQVIEMKHEYNKKRPYRHGGKVI